jgi:serine/threonine protein kinase/tetratricopeptide (TPR) repeat protein
VSHSDLTCRDVLFRAANPIHLIGVARQRPRGSEILNLPPDQWRLFSEALDQALDTPEADRAQWLAALAIRSPDIAAKVADALAQGNRAASAGFLEEPLLLPRVAPVSATLVGRNVGPYVIEAEIGSGGMGSVWRARRVDDRFETTVAVKFLHASWIGLQGEQRFRAEGQILGRLDHPNIARLIDAGLLDTTHPYLVLEYVEGEAIDAYCSRQQLNVEQRVTLFLGVLAAVAHAHSHLIVHRDIKPANIFVTRTGSAKLLDFGIAKLLDYGADASPLTKSSATALTPLYAAPEQLQGKPVTTATDVYSLGLVLYVLLTGRHPIAVEPGSNAQLIHAMLTEDAPRASAVSLMSTISRRALEGDLDNILGKALKKSADERYESVGAFADDLKRYLTHEPVKAHADTVTYRMTKFVRRHRGGVLSGVLTLIILCAASIITFLQKMEADRQRDAAQFEARRAQSANEFLDVLLLSDGNTAQSALTAADRVELGVRMLERQYQDDPRFAGRMLVELSTQYRGMTNTAQAVALDSRAYELGKAAQDTELMASAQCAATFAETTAGLTRNGQQRIAEAKLLMAQLREPALGVRISCYRAEAELQIHLNNSMAAEQTLEVARRLLEESRQTYLSAYTSVLNELGGIYNETSRLNQALEMTQLVGATQEKFGRGGTTARLITLQNEATVLFNMGEILASLSIAEDVQKRRLAIQGDTSGPLSMTVRDAERLVRLGRSREALDLAKAAVASARSAGNSRWLIFALRTATESYLDLGELTAAEATIDEMRMALANGSPTDASYAGLADYLRGMASLHHGDLSAALQSANASVATIGAVAIINTRNLRTSLNLASTAAIGLGHPADGERFARQSLDLAQTVARGPDTSADVGEALLLLAKAEIAQGRSAEAQPLIERAARCLTHGVGADHPLSREAMGLATRASGKSGTI